MEFTPDLGWQYANGFKVYTTNPLIQDELKNNNSFQSGFHSALNSYSYL